MLTSHIRLLKHVTMENVDYVVFHPQTSELGVTEHIEGDPCKFALWAGRTPSSDNKTVLKVPVDWRHFLTGWDAPQLKPKKST